MGEGKRASPPWEKGTCWVGSMRNGLRGAGADGGFPEGAASESKRGGRRIRFSCFSGRSVSRCVSLVFGGGVPAGVRCFWDLVLAVSGWVQL